MNSYEIILNIRRKGSTGGYFRKSYAVYCVEAVAGKRAAMLAAKQGYEAELTTKGEVRVLSKIQR